MKHLKWQTYKHVPLSSLYVYFIFLTVSISWFKENGLFTKQKLLGFKEAAAYCQNLVFLVYMPPKFVLFNPQTTMDALLMHKIERIDHCVSLPFSFGTISFFIGILT
jgi:hypothetical protein